MNKDLSHKDGKYFLSGDTYNCPFCNRRNVRFTVNASGDFNWSNCRTVFFYKILCSDCNMISFHLSDYRLKKTPTNTFQDPPANVTYNKFQPLPNGPASSIEDIQKIVDKNGHSIEFDSLFFFHQPTSFFTIDSRIPSSIREPFAESENCLKNNFLTGSSAGLRKAIYKLLKHENIVIQDVEGIFLDIICKNNAVL